jgi:hypothetical protein
MYVYKERNKEGREKTRMLRRNEGREKERERRKRYDRRKGRMTEVRKKEKQDIWVKRHEAHAVHESE